MAEERRKLDEEKQAWHTSVVSQIVGNNSKNYADESPDSGT